MRNCTFFLKTALFFTKILANPTKKRQIPCTFHFFPLPLHSHWYPSVPEGRPKVTRKSPEGQPKMRHKSAVAEPQVKRYHHDTTI